VILRKAAEGDLPLPPAERIEILTLLASRQEPKLRAIARATLQAWDGGELLQVLASPMTSPEVLCFAAEHLVSGREDLKAALVDNPGLPEEIRKRLQFTPAVSPMPKESAVAPSFSPASTPAASPFPTESARELLARLTTALEQGDSQVVNVLPPEIEAPPEAIKLEELTRKERETLLQKIGRMSAVEKIKAALTGNQETRVILIRDPNKTVARAVLQSPKLNETELEGYAASKNVSEEILRLIAINRKFMKSNIVVRALVNNPRAPIDIALPLVKHLIDRDLKGVSLNRNIPDVIRTMAIKLIKQKEEASKPKLPRKH